jgi:hypothetical protein
MESVSGEYETGEREAYEDIHLEMRLEDRNGKK